MWIFCMNIRMVACLQQYFKFLNQSNENFVFFFKIEQHSNFWVKAYACSPVLCSVPPFSALTSTLGVSGLLGRGLGDGMRLNWNACNQRCNSVLRLTFLFHKKIWIRNLVILIFCNVARTDWGSRNWIWEASWWITCKICFGRIVQVWQGRWTRFCRTFWIALWPPFSR